MLLARPRATTRIDAPCEKPTGLTLDAKSKLARHGGEVVQALGGSSVAHPHREGVEQLTVQALALGDRRRDDALDLARGLGLARAGLAVNRRTHPPNLATLEKIAT